MKIRLNIIQVLGPLFLLFFFSLPFSGPPLIHFCNRLTTSPTEKRANTTLYLSLAEAELNTNLTTDERNQLHTKRIALYYWFNARGWDIDEGDEPISCLTRWKNLISYWKS